MTGQTFGKYRVLEKIGRGGMGTVYRAVDEILQREVAIKVLNPELNEPEVTARFRNEAVTVARANHPGIATVYELFQHESQLFMVMEFVRGDTVEALLSERGTLAVPQAVQISFQALGALSHAHRLGIIHRDLKPANLMITDSGVVKIMDFGIARVVGSEHLTVSGFMMGTPAFMSPEQVIGRSIDHRADLYSMGVVLYRMLSGKLPFKGDTAFLLAQSQVNDVPTPLRVAREGLPGWLDPIIDRALAKDADLRFQSADEFRLALEPYVPAGGTDALRVPIVASEDAPTAAPGSVRRLEVARPVSAAGTPIQLGDSQPHPPAGPAAPVSAPNAAATAPAKADTVVLRKGTLAWGAGVLVTILLLLGGGAVVLLVRGFGARQPATDQPAAPVPAPPADQTAPAPEATPPPTGAPPPAAGPQPSPTITAASPPPPGSPAAPTTSQAAARPTAPAKGPTSVNATPAAKTPPTLPATETTATLPPAPLPAPAPAPSGVVAMPKYSLLAFSDVRLVSVTGTRGREQDVLLNFSDDRVAALAAKQGTVVRSMPYSSITHATYSRSDEPRWQAGPASPPDRLDAPGSFLGRARHWLTLQSNEEYLILRLDDSNWKAIVDAIETRTPVKVSRPTK